MGKGKKKDKKDAPKEALPPIESLSLEPSTSQSQPAAESEPPAPPKDEEESVEDLTGGTKKKRPRKKKVAAETDEPKPPQPKQQVVKQSEQLPTAQPASSVPAESLTTRVPSRGRGRASSFGQAGPYQPGGPTQVRGPPPTQGPPAFQRGPPPFQQQPGGPPDTWRQGPGQRGPSPVQHQPGGPPQFRGPPPSHGLPVHWGHGPGQAGPAPVQQQPGGPFHVRAQTPRDPSAAWTPGPAPQPVQTGPSPVPSTPASEPQGQPQRPSGAGGPRGALAKPQPQPQKQAGVVSIYEERRAREREAILNCRYRIPAKIIGNKVRCNPLRVLVNYLPLDIKPIKVYRYDVAFKPDKPKKMVPVAFNAFIQKTCKNLLVAFDQSKNFYSAKQLPGVNDQDRRSDTVVVKDPNGRDMTFEVSIKATGMIDLQILLDYMRDGTSLNPPTEAIQCVDVILRQGTLVADYVKAGRSFFRRPERPIPLGDGLEMWTGLFQSAIFTGRPWINIDVAHKGFPIKQPVTRLAQEFRLDSSQPLRGQRGFDHLETMMRGLKISAFLGGDSSVRRELICNGFGQSADKQTFIITDPQGREVRMTVAEYFAKVKGLRLKTPYMETLWLGPRDKNIYYPIEFCEVSAGQVLNKQLNDRQLATMVKEAATPPNIRKAKIEDVVRAMDYPRNVYLREFSLNVADKFAEVNAKILQAPIIKYSDKTAMPKNGAWWSSKMLVGCSIERWAFIAVERNVSQVNGENIARQMMNSAGTMGIRMASPVSTVYNVPTRALAQCLDKYKGQGVQLCFVVIPNQRGPVNVYSEIKKSAERVVGMLTQCVREQTLQRFSDQTAKNILLKINAKMTGVNHSIDGRSLPGCLRSGRVMVVGADVTHPSPDQQNIPSIAAVTASMDPACTVYGLQMSIQTPKLETIVEFEDMMVEHLKEYKKRNKTLPEMIYVFRDGVSEGQFALMLNTELVAAYNAYRRLSGVDKKPQVLFLLVQKRHHTRLFNVNNSYNVQPGTVVDTDIVHQRELDFYLVSHQAIKGTARPTRYYCICNDGRMPHDEVEQLAFYLCHLYNRCSRAVSYPAPTYYAHLACLRARTLTLGEQFNNSDLEKRPRRLTVLDNMHQTNPMFFV